MNEGDGVRSPSATVHHPLSPHTSGSFRYPLNSSMISATAAW